MDTHDERRDVEDLVRWLERDGDCRLEPGLSPAEIDRAERAFDIRMPPLWRRVLEQVHPWPGNGWPRCRG